MNQKASVMAMVFVLVLAIIGLGAISAFVKIQLQSSGEPNSISGMAVAEPEVLTNNTEQEAKANNEDKTPPSKPKFSIES